MLVLSTLFIAEIRYCPNLIHRTEKTGHKCHSVVTLTWIVRQIVQEQKKQLIECHQYINYFCSAGSSRFSWIFCHCFCLFCVVAENTLKLHKTRIHVEMSHWFLLDAVQFSACFFDRQELSLGMDLEKKWPVSANSWNMDIHECVIMQMSRINVIRAMLSQRRTIHKYGENT